MGSGVTLAYWAPQGGYVDIPAHPQKGQPKLVLTPGFSGCTFVADKLNENTLRVRHVQGGKEDLEYNNLPDEAHGLGMISAMEYKIPEPCLRAWDFIIKRGVYWLIQKTGAANGGNSI